MSTPATIGDLIAQQQAAAAAVATATAALSAASAALAQDSAALAGGLTAVGGPVYTLDSTQSPPVVTAYLSDASPQGFHLVTMLPASTPLPTAPPPGPEPAEGGSS
jgi:hypothetical protein